jgi:hypothetical protein
MNNIVKKSVARFLAIELAPECGEVLAAFRAKSKGWVKMPEEIERVYKGLGLGPFYVVAYEDELRIFNCLYKAFFLEDAAEELREAEEELLACSEEEQLALFREDALPAIDESLDELLESFFHRTEQDREAARLKYEALTEDERKDSLFRLAMFMAFFYSFFYNILSLMVHGQKLTTLVPLALKGDKEAFCKAIQIDRNLLEGHRYFRETYARLQSGDDQEFLKDVLYRIGNPTTRGKIRFPALYALFSILEHFGWLDDFTAPELLDVCDEAKLDRFQNRIEDENYLTRRRLEYRRFQKIRK